MIKLVTMYSVVCDRCGKSFIDESNGIVAWLDEGSSWWEVNRVPEFYKNQFKKLEDDTKADMEGRNQNFNN